MEIKGSGKLLRVYVGADDRLKGKPLFEAIVLQLREIGLAGATVLRAGETINAAEVTFYCLSPPSNLMVLFCCERSGNKPSVS